MTISTREVSIGCRAFGSLSSYLARHNDARFIQRSHQTQFAVSVEICAHFTALRCPFRRNFMVGMQVRSCH
eukprot:scaffold668894_cov61-Prasinocladus_malaysianus.AAC.1